MFIKGLIYIQWAQIQRGFSHSHFIIASVGVWKCFKVWKSLLAIYSIHDYQSDTYVLCSLRFACFSMVFYWKSKISTHTCIFQWIRSIQILFNSWDECSWLLKKTSSILNALKIHCNCWTPMLTWQSANSLVSHMAIFI